MSTVAKALLEAREEIFITDWMYVGKILVTMYLYTV